MSFLRKASISRKKDREGAESSKPSARGDRPPRANTKDDDKPKHKGRRRLASLFSSSSLSSLASDRDREGSPVASRQISQPTLISGPSSGNSTPRKKSPFAVNGVSNGVAKLSVNSNTPLSDSPEASPTLASPTHGVAGSRFLEGVPGAPTPSPAAPAPRAASSTFPESPTKTRLPSTISTEQRRERTSSMYSQWDLSAAAEEDSSDDDEEAYLTPSEGLSEVEEEPEEEDAQVVTNNVTNQTLDKTNVEKGARAGKGDVRGTGPSTVHRSVATVDQTKVRKRHAKATKPLSASEQAEHLAEDLDTCRNVMTLFLTSQMKDAEDVCFDKDPEGNRLYLISAQGIINALKGMMTFDSNDLANALEICKATSHVASTLRKPSDSFASRIGGLVRPGAGVQRVKAMTDLERHAELVYAETSLMKAMLAIIAGGDWLGLIREALNMRTAHGIYRNLQHFLDDADKGGYDDDIDMDFRSGVLLGTGVSSLMLSLLPGKVLKIAEVFGYAGDRKVALETLMSAGGWSADSDVPSYTEKNEGVRRPVCDIILLAFHLVISVLMPVDGIDIPLARKVLAYNINRYPDGIFFLYFQARLHTTQCEPELAIQSLQKALDLELEYIQMQHMCLWDYSLNFLQLWDIKGALDCYNDLMEESNWSRATYTYAAAACLVELADDGKADMAEADKLMKLVPQLTKKIAGKSLPIEKLVARKTRKFESQGHRLFLPAEELAYVFGALGYCPRDKLLEVHYPKITAKLDKLESTTRESYGAGYWDDYALGHFLRGYVLCTARYQPKDAVESAAKPLPGQPSDDELDKMAEKDLQAVVRHATDVELDHYILYHCHYELGRLYARRGNKDDARKEFDVVMSGKLPETMHHQKKAQGKYSLEGALLLKTHAALQGLNKGEVV